jgi:hypothetical protein
MSYFLKIHYDMIFKSDWFLSYFKVPYSAKEADGCDLFQSSIMAFPGENEENHEMPLSG